MARHHPDPAAVLRRLRAVADRPTHTDAERQRIRCAILAYLAAREHRDAVTWDACQGPDPERALDHVGAVEEEGDALAALADALGPDSASD